MNNAVRCYLRYYAVAVDVEARRDREQDAVHREAPLNGFGARARGEGSQYSMVYVFTFPSVEMAANLGKCHILQQVSHIRYESLSQKKECILQGGDTQLTDSVEGHPLRAGKAVRKRRLSEGREKKDHEPKSEEICAYSKGDYDNLWMGT